jgi:Ca-activated chloride channel family protein
MLEAFHFQQPAWFLALLPLVLLLWQLRGHGSTDSAWRRVCDASLLPYLLVNPQRNDSRLPLWLLAAGWLIAVIALADPVWEKQPQPVFRSEEARVVVLDLSRSMASSDLKPSRLERARYKVEDVLRRSKEGQVGLVVFAGDAFVVTPLTQDARTITELLKTLEPGLMPVQGSRVDLGLRKAGELLTQAGAGRGEILLVTDGYEGDQALDAARELRRQGYTVSVLGVGTAQGAPLSDGAGGFVHDEKGAIVVPRLDVASLRALATAGGGRYATITGNDADINALLTPLVPRLNAKVKQTGLETDAWRSRGPWLIALLLPLAALAFRRGWLLGVVLLVAATAVPPQPAMASTWDDLWTRRDQQATDPEQRGTAQYRAGQYKEALADFTRASGPDAAYNQGNALARLGRYQEAIAAYDKALAAQPHMGDALHNKAAVEALLRQQKKQEKQNQQQQQGQQKQGQQKQQQGQQSGQKSSESGKQGGGKGDSSNHPDQQTAQQESGQGKDDSAAQAANGKEAQNDKASKSSADAAQDRQDKASANDKAASQAEARKAGQKGDEPQDNKDAAGAGQSLAKNKAENPDKNPAGNEAKEQPPAAEQISPEAARQQAAERPAGREPAGDTGAAGTQAAADTTSTEEQQATEQWLRRIPDDPGGLLRRKFLYQYRQRAASSDSDGGQTW